MAYDTDNVALVIDNGSRTCKAGFAGDDAPRSVLPSVIGRHDSSGIMFGEEAISKHYTLEAENKRGILTLNYPVQNGIVTNWDDMETIWFHAFHDELRIAPQDHAILLTEPPLNPKANRERSLEVLFETFTAPAAYLANQAILCLYGTEHTGTVVLCGEGVTYIVPVYSGCAIEHAVTRFDIAGRELSIRLEHTLAGRGYPWHMFGSGPTDPGIVTLKDIKENYSYVALDWARELNNIPPSNYTREYQLPNMLTLSLDTERCCIPEPLFRPQLLSMKCEGIHHAICDAISKCDEELHQAVYCNIVLSGGSTMFPGFAERLTKEITALAPPSLDVNIVAPPERHYSVWIGGSILASLSTFEKMWISRSEYEEQGSRIVHQRMSRL